MKKLKAYCYDRDRLGDAVWILLIAIGVWLVSDFRWDVVWQSAPFLLKSLGVSWELAIVSTLIGLLVGTCLAAARQYGILPLRYPAVLYIELVRAIPQIMVIFWVFLGLPRLTGYVMAPWLAAVLALSMIASAYLAEVIRAGLMSVSKVHRESGYVTGLTSTQIFVFIILPQALRNMLPALIAHVVMIFKLTTLVYLLGMVDFFRASILVNNREYAPYAIYLTMAIVYIACNTLLSGLIKKIDPKYALTS
jgi:His/Glu/Gln/Arg/opine family amino acid ABC transporter permease subunit